jgi:hypothetical protein
MKKLWNKTENKKKNQDKKKRKAATGPTQELDQPSSHRTSPPAAPLLPSLTFYLFFILFLC